MPYDVEEIMLMLSHTAKTENKKVALRNSIENALHVEVIYGKYDKISARQDKVQAQVKKHLQQSLELLQKLSTSNGFLNPNNKLIQCLEDVEVKRTASKSDMINSNLEIISQDLLACGFSKTSISDDIIPTLKQLIKGKL